MDKKLLSLHAEMLKRRGYDPKNYKFIKSTYVTVWFRDIRTGKVLPINKFGNN